jgi:hypothetical protein
MESSFQQQKPLTMPTNYNIIVINCLRSKTKETAFEWPDSTVLNNYKDTKA